MRGDEAWVQTAFLDAVETSGSPSPFACAVVVSGSHDLDVETAYGQLLRSVETPPLPEDQGADYQPPRYAIVVRTGRALVAAKRVPVWVRSTLAIDIYEVRDDGSVTLHGSTPVTDPANFQGSNFGHRDNDR